MGAKGKAVGIGDNRGPHEETVTSERFRTLGDRISVGFTPKFSPVVPASSWNIRLRRQWFSFRSKSICSSSSPTRSLLRFRDIAADSRFLSIRCCFRVSFSSMTVPSAEEVEDNAAPPILDEAACLAREADSFLRRLERAWAALGLTKATPARAPNCPKA